LVQYYEDERDVISEDPATVNAALAEMDAEDEATKVVADGDVEIVTVGKVKISSGP
jgi:hypothetical protein